VIFLEKRLERLEKGQNELKADVTELKTDVTGIKEMLTLTLDTLKTVERKVDMAIVTNKSHDWKFKEIDMRLEILESNV